MSKTPESRHAEHDLMFEEFKKMQAWREEFTNSITEAIARHGDTINQHYVETLKQLSSIKDGIAEKMSMDSGLMVRQSNIEGVSAKLVEQHDAIIRTMERQTGILEGHKKQIDDAHSAIRGVNAKVDSAVHDTDAKVDAVGKRVDVIEGKGGKIAMKILVAAGALAATVTGTLVIQSIVRNLLIVASAGVAP